MKSVYIILLSFFLFSCGGLSGRITLEDYKSVQQGPRAKIKLTSPYLDVSYGTVYRIAIYVYEYNGILDGNCSFSLKGKIPLSEGKDENWIYVPANQRIYLALNYQNKTYIGRGTTSFSKTLLFSFVPEDGREYTIEHVDNPGLIRANYYVKDRTNKAINNKFDVNDIGNGFYFDANRTCPTDRNAIIK